MFTDSQVTAPPARWMPMRRSVCAWPVRTVTRVGRSDSGSGVPSARMHGSSEVKPGLPISCASGRPTMRSAARLPAMMLSERS